ncbi:MAG: hypothetical protein HQK66_04015 [Desulfamplus sp.]|nr:hypothetical protein [Desulfamplus sp.]
MGSISPQGENLKKAISWISEQRLANPDQSDLILAENAAIRFDLNPDDSEFLLRFIKEPDSINN